MSKYDFYLSHKRDNSCWTSGWVPDLSECYRFRLKEMTRSKSKPNSFWWPIEFLIAKISSDVSVNECQSNNIKRHYLFNDWRKEKKGGKNQGPSSDKWLLFSVPLPENIKNDLKICSYGQGAKAVSHPLSCYIITTAGRHTSICVPVCSLCDFDVTFPEWF